MQNENRTKCRCRYAVACGRNPGVYENWRDCKDQVKGYSGAVFKSFPSRQEAQEFCGERVAHVKQNGVSVAPATFKNQSMSTPVTARVISAYSKNLAEIHDVSSRRGHVSVV